LITGAGSGFLAVEGELFDDVVVLREGDGELDAVAVFREVAGESFGDVVVPREVAAGFLEVVVFLATVGALFGVAFLEADRASDGGVLFALLPAFAVAARAFPFPEFFAALAVLVVDSVEVFGFPSESAGWRVFLFSASRLDESGDAAEDLSEESTDDATDF
jgi:hypothetical protein